MRTFNAFQITVVLVGGLPFLERVFGMIGKNPFLIGVLWGLGVLGYLFLFVMNCGLWEAWLSRSKKDKE